MVHPFEAFIEISVDFEEIMARVEAAANTFGAYLLRTRRKRPK